MEVRINVKEACRLCLQGEGKLSVFENDSNFGSINAETIFSCVSITINKEDNLPKGICSCCLQYVEEWSSFKVTCARAQELLQAWLREDVLEKQEIVLKPEVVKENVVNLTSPFKNVDVPNSASASQVDEAADAEASSKPACAGEVENTDTDPALQSSLEFPLPPVSYGVLVDGKPADVSVTNEVVSSEIPPVVPDDKDSKNIADSDDFLSSVGQTDVPSSSAEAFEISESYETCPDVEKTFAFLQQNTTLGSCLDNLIPPVSLGDLVPEDEHTDPSETFAAVLEDNVSDDAVTNYEDIGTREAVANASSEEAMEISESVFFKKETTPGIESSLDDPLPLASLKARAGTVVPDCKRIATLESQKGSTERPGTVFESKDFIDLLNYDKEADVVVASVEEGMDVSESTEAYPDPVNPVEPTSLNKNSDLAIESPVDVDMPPALLATTTGAVVTGSELNRAPESQEVISAEITAIVLEDKVSNAAVTDVMEIDAAEPTSNEGGVNVFESFGTDPDTTSSLKKYPVLTSDSSLGKGIPRTSLETAISEDVPEVKLSDATSETTSSVDNHSDDLVTNVKRPSDVLDPGIVSSKEGTMKVSESFATCSDVNNAGSASLGELKDLGFVLTPPPPSTAVSTKESVSSSPTPGSSQVINNNTLAIVSEYSDPKLLPESDVSMSNINTMEVSERSDVEDTKEVSKFPDATSREARSCVKHSSETTTLEKPTELPNIVATESVVPGTNSSAISKSRENSNETSTDVMNSSSSCQNPIESVKPTETTVSLCVPGFAEESSLDISSNVVKSSEQTYQEEVSGLFEVTKTVSIRESESDFEKLENVPNTEKASPFKIPLVILKSGESSAIERPLDPQSDQPSTESISLCSTDEFSENEEGDGAQLEGNIKINEVCSLTKLDDGNNDMTCNNQSPTSGVKTPVENVEDQRGVVSSSVVTPTDEKEVSSSVGKPSSSAETPEPRVERPAPPTSQPPFPVVGNIKEEPIDSTTEEITASQRFLRVKSEFSGVIGEEMIEEDTDLSSSDDPTNTDCRICQRKYSSVRAYKAHLRTKTHLANEGLSPVIPKEQPPEPVQSLESPLLRSRLSSEPLQVPGFFEPDNDSAWSLEIDPPPMKRDRPFIDHCALCNISFRVVYDVKRHRLSKKHRLNERIARAKQSRRPPPTPVTPHLLFEPAPSHVVDSRPPPSIFICPMQSCRFSCDNGDNLLLHMKAHGFGQPLSAEGERLASSQFSYTHRQSMLRREAEARMKREAEVRMRRDEEIRKYRELELKVEREVKLNKRRESELQMLRMGDAGMRRHPEDQFLGQMSRPPVRDAYGRFKCEACAKVFVRESGLRKHSWYCCPPPEGVKQSEGEVNFGEDMGEMGDEHLASQEALPAYTAHCPLCDISFTARNVFINHVQIYHKGSYLESCLPQTPNSPMNLPHQPLIKSPLPVKKSTKPTIKAPSVQVPNKLRITNKTHGFNCEICGKKFNLLSSLNFHLKSHTTGIKHICRICKQPFANKRHFTDHCRQHFVKRGSKEELCHECFKVFKTRSDLFQHKKNGQCSFKLKIYSCNICDHSFKESSALEKHKVRFHSESLDISEANNETLDELSTASGEAEYPFLSLKFEENQPSTSSSASNWISRESIDPNPSSSLHCSICNKTFTWKSSFVKHNNTFHSKNKISVVKKVKSDIETSPLKPWKCKHCKNSFATRKSLINHLRKCDYNAITYEKGVCLQCGGPTSSSKSMICPFCLPAIALDWRKLKKFQKSNEIIKKGQGESSSQKLDEEELVQVQKAMKEEFLKSEFESQPLGESYVEDKVAVKDTAEKQTSNLPGGVRALMKCPVGQKYFRNELLMLRHYAECDGSCENRCSNCRKPFTSAGEYQHHLLVESCKKTTNFSSKKKSKNKMRYPTFACKKKRPRRDHSNGSESKPLVPDNAPEESSDNAISTYSEEGSMLGFEPIAGTSQSEELDEKCTKLGRICTFCNKVINYHRAYYRHYYDCLKRLFARKITVSCPKCKMSFSRLAKKIDIGLAIKQHILKCHFIPYYPGEGLLEDGSQSNVPPEHMCYVCSFGFTSEEAVREHVKLHKGDKDEVNRQVLQLEEILLGEERMTSQDALTNFYLDTPPLAEGSLAVKVGRSLSLLEGSLTKPTATTKIYKCDVCFRKFLNENKYLRHKRIHGIIEERVLKKVRLDVPSEDESDVIVLE